MRHISPKFVTYRCHWSQNCPFSFASVRVGLGYSCKRTICICVTIFNRRAIKYLPLPLSFTAVGTFFLQKKKILKKFQINSRPFTLPLILARPLKKQTFFWRLPLFHLQKISISFSIKTSRSLSTVPGWPSSADRLAEERSSWPLDSDRRRGLCLAWLTVLLGLRNKITIKIKQIKHLYKKKREKNN